MIIKKIIAVLGMLIISSLTVVNISDREQDCCKPQAEVAEASIETVEKHTFEAGPSWLEEYVIGVVGAEMPVNFGIEALKAQAVASRTYAYRAYQNNNSISCNEIGQVYMDNNQLKNKWGNKFEEYYDIIKTAVEETKGEIMVYDNEAILAVFSAASSGMTESSENMWGSDLPYLKTVESHYDENAPVFYGRKEISTDRLAQALGTGEINSSNCYVLQRSQAGYVLELMAAGKKISGSQFRSILGLKSTNFTLEFQNNNVIITTKGYGHGVGMSQYGAGYMAQEGCNYREILQHYYIGTEIVKTGEE